jgi:hypothetical protein
MLTNSNIYHSKSQVFIPTSEFPTKLVPLEELEWFRKLENILAKKLFYSLLCNFDRLNKAYEPIMEFGGKSPFSYVVMNGKLLLVFN